MQLRQFLTGFILALVLVAPLSAFGAPAPVNVGDRAPDFSLDDLQGRAISLSGYRGSVVLLNFWGSFCMPCRAEMPELNKLYLSFKDRGFVVIGLSLDRSEAPVKALVQSQHLEFPVCMDLGKKVFYEKYATFALPLTYLIDKKGMIVEKFFGREDWNSPGMQERIRKLTAEQ